MTKVHIIITMILFLFSAVFAFADYPDKPPTTHIYVFRTNDKIEIVDGMDVSGKNFHNVVINRLAEDLKNINFSGCNLSCGNFDETFFVNCSFRTACLNNIDAPGLHADEQCDFTDADIQGSSIWDLTVKQLLSTRSYKEKQLYGYCPCNKTFLPHCENISLKSYNLTNCKFKFVKGCNFEDANIEDAGFKGFAWNGQYRKDKPNQYYPVLEPSGLTKEQLLSTKNFKKGNVLNVHFIQYESFSVQSDWL
jgi:hypothetical protein